MNEKVPLPAEAPEEVFRRLTQGEPITLELTLERGWQVRIRMEMEPGKGHLTAQASVLRNGRPATKREEELWSDTTIAMVVTLVKELASVTGAEDVATKLAEWLDRYKKATYMCRSAEPSPERKEAVLFLKSWRRDTLAAQESGQKIPDSDQIKLLSPLLTALGKLDGEFFKGLTEGVQILSNRILNSKDGSGEHLTKT
jgi:hypothetical protein